MVTFVVCNNFLCEVRRKKKLGQVTSAMLLTSVTIARKKWGDDHICGVTHFCPTCKIEVGEGHECGKLISALIARKKYPRITSTKRLRSNSFDNSKIKYKKACL